MYCIYKITDLRNEKVIYIGKTNNFNKRRCSHFTQASRPISKYMLEQGREHFEMTKIVDDIETNDDAVKLEDHYIVELNPIMNKYRSGNITADMKKYNIEREKSEKRKEYKKTYQPEYQRQYQKSEQWREYKKEYQRQWRLKKKQEQQNDNQ